MIAPDFERFVKLAADYTVIPVYEELLADSLTPIGAFRSLVEDGDGFLLESVEHVEQFSRYSFVGRHPVTTFKVSGDQLSIVTGALPPGIPQLSGVLVALEELLVRYRSPSISDLPPFHGGIVGYLGYDVVREIERLGQAPRDDLGLPDALCSVVGEVVAFDHHKHRVTLIDNVVLDEVDEQSSRDIGDLREAYDRAVSCIERMRHDLEKPVRESLSSPPSRTEQLDPSAVHRVVSSESYQQSVAAAKEYILAGDAFQIVLSQRFDLDLGVEPFEVYRVLRQVNPSPYMFFLRQGGVCVVGASPEPLVQLQSGRVISRPIAGTRRRGATDEEDRRLGAELIEHPKEIAEHIMLVDLARNDVGRVVKFGTERVDELMTLEHYSHVMHLTSQVSGELVEGKGPIDVLRATLPAGTVSGAPKVRAMQIIDELEPTKRGPYAGIVGYFDFSGNFDTAIAIRTLVVTPDGRGSVQAGAGIVADSDPVGEDAECVAKAQSILSAVAGARRITEERIAGQRR